MAGHEDDRHIDTTIEEDVLNLQAIKTGHLHVEKDAARLQIFQGIDEIATARKGPTYVTGFDQHPNQHLPDNRLVIDDIDGSMLSHVPCSAARAVGRYAFERV